MGEKRRRWGPKVKCSSLTIINYPKIKRHPIWLLTHVQPIPLISKIPINSSFSTQWVSHNISPSQNVKQLDINRQLWLGDIRPCRPKSEMRDNPNSKANWSETSTVLSSDHSYDYEVKNGGQPSHNEPNKKNLQKMQKMNIIYFLVSKTPRSGK